MNADHPMRVKPVEPSRIVAGRRPPAAQRGLRAFTLIELLVVIAIILVLSGISMKVMSLVGRKSATAKTLYVLEQTKNALEAYYVAVGTYPPVTDTNTLYVRAATTAHLPYVPNLPVRMGLVYYLKYMSDARLDSWAKFASKVVSRDADQYATDSRAGAGTFRYTNTVEAIRDGWSRQIYYVPNSDFSSYMLWSAGVDGLTLTPAQKADDIGVGNNE